MANESSGQVIAEYLEFAHEIANQARKTAVRHFRNSPGVSYKPDDTPVTECDIEIETMARGMVAERYPEHGFKGEELPDHAVEKEWVWVLDPIDGTEPFILGLPTFGILLGLTRGGRPVLGIIDMPALAERFCAGEGGRTTWRGKPCSTNAQAILPEAIVSATSIDHFEKSEFVAFEAVSAAARRRRFGVDCYAYGLLASGSIDVVMESSMKTPDIMALVPVVERAGGVITDWRGDSLTIESTGQVLATANQSLHEECLGVIRESGC